MFTLVSGDEEEGQETGSESEKELKELFVRKFKFL